ncbi:hypothetical protein [Streptomyces yaizuensis]|uniref:Uncharacterized protein n=1 Tax=Streptomyces yaizuensis TaxID=2989713 RepID=A0ABQ5P673_9ACTN|nr:hypothetical protein [Streptomyces sp. YSPA8]GLF98062.1 hypothetical protein SYYSPA8_27215 [Streptomyces sp. YSPA8]
MNPTPQAAHYGLGAIFPVVVIDARPVWHQPSTSTPPERHPQGRELLALRWSGPDDADDEAVDTLRRAAHHDPDTALAAFAARPPAGLRLIALRPSALLGPWGERPGRATHHP